MKKFLSVMLAVVMFVSCVPFALAYYDDEIPEVAAEFYEAVFGYYGRMSSVCTKDNKTGVFADNIEELNDAYENKLPEEQRQAFIYAFEKLEEFRVSEEKPHGIKYYSENEPEKLIEIIETFNTINNWIDEVIDESGYTKVIDSYSYIVARYINEWQMQYYEYDFLSAFGNFAGEKTNIGHLIQEHYKTMRDMLFSAEEDITSVTQEEFDAETEAVFEIYRKALDCFAGNHELRDYTDRGSGTHETGCKYCTALDIIEAHTFGQHIPDDNGTTATAKCEKCDATDVIEVEWTELPAEDNSNIFTMLIATLKDIFAKITEFFQKLFG